jgi:hypothetical protein
MKKVRESSLGFRPADTGLDRGTEPSFAAGFSAPRSPTGKTIAMGRCELEWSFGQNKFTEEWGHIGIAQYSPVQVHKEIYNCTI